MKCRYISFREALHSDELGDYESFGIRVLTASGEEIAAVSDVSPDGALVDELCRRCNEDAISPLHLLDVIERSI